MRMHMHGQAPIISMILIIMIVLVVIAGMMLWATPTIQRMQDEALYRSSMSALESLDWNIETVMHQGEDATATTRFSLGGGELYFEDANWSLKDGQRWAISYGLNDTLSFEFFGLDDFGDSFELTSTSEINVSISIYWPDENIGPEPPAFANPIDATPTPVTASRNLNGTVNILVNNETTNETLAELWLFDISAWSYKLASSTGEYAIRYVNAGILTGHDESRWVYNDPMFVKLEGSMLFYVVDMALVDGSVSSGGSGTYTVSATTTDVYVRTPRSYAPTEGIVYNLTIQIYDSDDWDDTWYRDLRTYFKPNWDFQWIYYNDPARGIRYSGGDIELKLVQCEVLLNVRAA